jgi:hypothetical protein
MVEKVSLIFFVVIEKFINFRFLFKDDENNDSAYCSIINSFNDKSEVSKDGSLTESSQYHQTIDETEYISDDEPSKVSRISCNNTKNKKVRTTFSDQQKMMLEYYFERNPYPDPKEAEDMSERLCLSENVIKVWFQNKRSRDKQRKFSRNKSMKIAEFKPHLNLQILSQVPNYAGILNNFFT